MLWSLGQVEEDQVGIAVAAVVVEGGVLIKLDVCWSTLPSLCPSVRYHLSNESLTIKTGRRDGRRRARELHKKCWEKSGQRCPEKDAILCDICQLTSACHFMHPKYASLPALPW